MTESGGYTTYGVMDGWSRFLAEKKADHIVLSKEEMNRLLADKHLLDRLEELWKVVNPISTVSYREHIGGIIF